MQQMQERVVKDGERLNKQKAEIELAVSYEVQVKGSPGLIELIRVHQISSRSRGSAQTS